MIISTQTLKRLKRGIEATHLPLKDIHALLFYVSEGLAHKENGMYKLTKKGSDLLTYLENK